MLNILEKNLNYLKINNKIINILNDNNIYNINDLWIKNRKYLKNLGLSDSEIKEIIIKLELIGLDLNKKAIKESVKNFV